MRNITVKYYIDTKEMITGNKPHSNECESDIVEAGSSREAIELEIDYLIEQIIQNSSLETERSGDSINVLNADGETVEKYYGFFVDSPVKELRENMGLSRAETARKLEMPLRTLEDWEYGRSVPAHWAEKMIIEKLESWNR